VPDDAPVQARDFDFEPTRAEAAEEQAVSRGGAMGCQRERWRRWGGGAVTAFERGFGLGRAAANSIVQVVGREGDWMQIEWAGARQSRPNWESKASAEGDEEKGWVQAEDRTSGKVYLERASGAAFFNLGQSTGNVESKAMSPEQLESVLREMRAVAQQDSDVEMTRVLGANAEAAKGDGRLDRAWQELRAVRSAKRAEDAHQEKVAALREQQERQIESGKEAHQAGRYAHRAWREQSWAERERAVASSLLS